VAAIGPATAERLASHGIRADVLPKEYRGEAVFTAIASASAAFGVGIERARVLLPRAQVAREALPDLLRSAGAHVDVVAAYKTVPPAAQAVDALVAQLKAGEVDAVTFTSSSTARNIVEMLGDHAGLLHGARLFSIGPVTSKTLADKGFSGISEAREYTIAGLTEALVEAFA
jgi:uroporphyrinogen III methyltransferase/synthase